MAGISWQEWLGYIASALVLVSLSMSSIARLRWFNLAGAICFAAYGVLIEAWPVALMNTAIAGVNVYYLIQLYTREDYFKTLMVSPHDAYLREFIDFHGDDVELCWRVHHSGARVVVVPAAAVSTAAACTMFGAVSGSTQATVVAIGGPLRPRMHKAGYNDSFILALIVAPIDGIPVAASGISSTLRDLARFGLLFTPTGRILSDPVVSDELLEQIQRGSQFVDHAARRDDRDRPHDAAHHAADVG